MTYGLQWNLLVDRRLDGAQTARYLHGPRTDEILRADIARASGSASRRSRVEAFYPLADGLGSTVALADDRGRIEQRYRYSAFGSPDVSANGRASSARGGSFRFLFTGREWIPQHGLAEHRFRYLSPILGRWVSVDPIRQADDINLYRYVRNRPTSELDPLGLACGFGWNDPFVPDNPLGLDSCWDANFTVPCERHDACYGTLGRPKQACDLQFWHDMSVACAAQNGGTVCRSACNQFALVYFIAVKNLGTSPYIAAQQAAGAAWVDPHLYVWNEGAAYHFDANGNIVWP
jgi:RHS repeat-associated protein